MARLSAGRPSAPVAETRPRQHMVAPRLPLAHGGSGRAALLGSESHAVARRLLVRMGPLVVDKFSM